MEKSSQPSVATYNLVTEGDVIGRVRTRNPDVCIDAEHVRLEPDTGTWTGLAVAMQAVTAAARRSLL